MSNLDKWIITGGSGYVGSHIANEFIKSGMNVVIYDSQQQGLQKRIDFLKAKHDTDIPYVIGDIRDVQTFSKVVETHEPFGIVHAAALKSVSESMLKEKEYFDVNLNGTSRILEICKLFEVENFIFSSTAAVYGSPKDFRPIKEGEETNPVSPYGASKLAAERAVTDFLKLSGNYGTSLRYFNVVGTGAPQLQDNSTENLVPIILNKFKNGQAPVIYGTDYETRDGTCLRDYIDVRDLARAHRLAAESIRNLPYVLNVGSGIGGTVREVINLVMHELGQKTFEPVEALRRSGDAAAVCADISLIKEVLEFTPEFSLQDSIKSLFHDDRVV
jgi:UDP-glucose 4-epimerase